MKHPSILLVDDSPTNLLVLEKFLLGEDSQKYEIVKASHGREALDILGMSPSKFDAVLLDIMMPGMSGIEVLKHIKKNDALKFLPVIIQSALTKEKDIAEGLKAGAFYYLTKPIEKKYLLPIVRTAVGDSQKYKSLKGETKKISNTIGFTKKWELEFKTIEDALNTASIISNMYPEPDMVSIGLSELMLNAVEHGNIGISYDEKTRLIDNGTWESETRRRLTLPENSKKSVFVKVERTDSVIRTLIRDCGEGFDWGQYIKMDIERAMDNHGRGIIMAGMSFDKVEYRGNGNEVLTVKKI